MAQPRSTVPQVRGSFLAQLAEGLKDRGYEASVIPKLSRTTQLALQASVADAWVDEEALVEVLRVARVAVRDDEAWQRILREESRRAIAKFFRLFLRFATPELLMLGLTRMWTMTHTGGRIVTRWRGASALTVEYRDHPPLASREYQDLTVAVLDVLLLLNRSPSILKALPAADPTKLFEVEVELTSRRR